MRVQENKWAAWLCDASQISRHVDTESHLCYCWWPWNLDIFVLVTDPHILRSATSRPHQMNIDSCHFLSTRLRQTSHNFHLQPPSTKVLYARSTALPPQAVLKKRWELYDALGIPLLMYSDRTSWNRMTAFFLIQLILYKARKSGKASSKGLGLIGWQRFWNPRLVQRLKGMRYLLCDYNV